jgi:hypothetical protein
MGAEQAKRRDGAEKKHGCKVLNRRDDAAKKKYLLLVLGVLWPSPLPVLQSCNKSVTRMILLPAKRLRCDAVNLKMRLLLPGGSSKGEGSGNSPS